MKRSPRDTEISSRQVNRRALMMGGAQAAFVALLGLRMRDLQVEQADQFRLLAEENRINVRLLPPARGPILDRNGVLIAGNEQNYRVVIVREDAGDVDAVLDRLSQLVTLAPEELDRARREMDRRSPFVPIVVADRMSWEDFSRVAVNGPALPGVTPEVGLSRSYPYGADFVHVLGYVGPVSEADLAAETAPDPLLQIPRFQIGKIGVEAKLDTALRGSAGSRRIEVNAVGRVMRELDRTDGTTGATVQMTLDANLQRYAQARLRSQSGSAVVIDIASGDVLAIASAPAYDPNSFVRGISSTEYDMLTSDEYRPLANKSVQGTYPPGSTFKMIVALAALEAGVITADDTVWCPGYKEVGDRRFNCWKRSGHGNVALHESMSASCDVFYYDVAERVGIEKITEMARRLGLGTRFDLPMSAVADGLTPTKQWKQDRRNEAWLVGDTLNAGIGQGFVLASPLQLAVMTARIASGRALVPRLVRAMDGRPVPAPPAPPLGVNENFLRHVRKGMFNVCNLDDGTAFSSRIAEDSLRMAGKTGTSQVRNITASERASGVISNDDLPWTRRDHALFVAFAPAEAPRYAVSVVVEHGGGGSTVAAPVARDILLQALYGGFPPLTAYPENQRSRIRSEQDELRALLPPLTPPERSRA